MDSPNLSSATIPSPAHSPLLRPVSPSPSVSPSFASGACSSLDRSASMPSSSSSLSSRSVSSSSQPSEANSSNRRRNGFMRPQGTAFAESARARDSVMCLGSIAALQYYFARTGLLEGKGAQMAKERRSPADATADSTGDEPGEEQEVEAIWESMEPPAVSTFRHKEPITDPLPDTQVLRRQLRQALDDAKAVLEEPTQQVQAKIDDCTITITTDEETAKEKPNQPGTQSWNEIQGLHILDLVTLAIRQARMYYVTHAHPHVLYALRPEREIRSDLYRVLDILKRMAARDFRGGIRPDEQSGVITWIECIRDLLSREERQEAEELARRRQWVWRHGDWSGRELERERLFLGSFDLDPSPLPSWEPSSSQPSDFLLALSKGLRLIIFHNEMVRRSTRPFGQITTFYTDLAKPYRCAENLRYWAKAAELRWEVKLDFNALDVVHGEGEEAWLRFEQAVQTWCKAVREELTQEWSEGQSRPGTAMHPLCRVSDEKAVIGF